MVMASVRLSLRLMLTHTFCMEDTMDMVLDMDTLVLDTTVLDTEFMESALLMLSQKLTHTFCTEDTMDMVLDMDTLVLDTTVLDTEFMENALLMPSQKLTPTFCINEISKKLKNIFWRQVLASTPFMAEGSIFHNPEKFINTSFWYNPIIKR